MVGIFRVIPLCEWPKFSQLRHRTLSSYVVHPSEVVKVGPTVLNSILVGIRWFAWLKWWWGKRTKDRKIYFLDRCCSYMYKHSWSYIATYRIKNICFLTNFLSAIEVLNEGGRTVVTHRRNFKKVSDLSFGNMTWIPKCANTQRLSIYTRSRRWGVAALLFKLKLNSRSSVLVSFLHDRCV